MKKIFLFAAIAAIMSGFAMAQEPDLELIAKMREIKGDSATIMLGKVYGTQTAMNHTTAEARQSFLKAFTNMMNLEENKPTTPTAENTAISRWRAFGLQKGVLRV